MTLSYGFYNSVDGDRIYSANEFSRLFDGILTDGIFQSIGNAFAVSEDTGLNGDVIVGSGRAWFDRTWTFNDTNLTLTVPAPDHVYDRIDSVVLEVDTTTRENSIKIVTGTPAGSPVAPTMLDDSGVYQHRLADIYVRSGGTYINNSHITNFIGTTETPFVTGILETIDMTWLFAQWESDFDTWFDNLVDQLSGTQVTNLQAQIDDIYSQLGSAGGGGNAYKNVIINGDMQVSQRGTSQTGITGAGLFKAPDRFKLALNSLGTYTVSQNTADAPLDEGFATAYKLDCTVANASPAAGAYFAFQTILKGQDLQRFKKGTANAESMAYSFLVRSSKTGTFIVEFVDTDNNRHVCSAVTIDSANVFEKKEVIIPPDLTGQFANDVGGSLEINIWLGAGSNFTSGTLQTSWTSRTTANIAVGGDNWGDNVANDFYITGIQLEVGDTVTAFEHLPFDIQRDRCLPYYEKSYNYNTDPGTATAVGSVVGSGSYAAATNTYLSAGLRFQKRKISNPTVTIYDTAGNPGKTDRSSIGSASSSNQPVGVAGIGENGALVYSGSAVTHTYLTFHYTAESEL